MGSSRVDVKAYESNDGSMARLKDAGRTNHTGQWLDEIVQSGNYCYSSFSVASIDEVKIQLSKVYHKHLFKPHVQTAWSFTWVEKGRVLLRLEL